MPDDFKVNVFGKKNLMGYCKLAYEEVSTHLFISLKKYSLCIKEHAQGKKGMKYCPNTILVNSGPNTKISPVLSP